MPNIDAFRAQLIGGGARSNQFRVTLTFPTFVSGAALAGQLSQFMVHSASLPESEVEQTTMHFRGRELKLAAERKFKDWTITCYNDTNFALRNAFMSWSNQINNISDNSGITNPSSYTSDILVTQLDRNGAELYTVKVVAAWPKTVDSIDLKFSDEKIEEFSVTLSYLRWEDNAAVGGV